MEKVLSFFRAFDLAFFAPGAFVFWTVHVSGLFGDLTPLVPSQSLGTVGGAIAVVMILVIVYVLGLVIHGLREALEGVFEPSGDGADETERPASWYISLDAKARDALQHYFWYMRATTANVGLALLIAAIVLIATGVAANAVLGLVFVLGALAAYYLSRRYNGALRQLSAFRMRSALDSSVQAAENPPAA